MPHAIILQPPPGNLTGPAAGPAYLKAYASEYGYDVRTWDTGIDAFQYFIAPQRLSRLVERAELLRQRLEAKGVLAPFEQRWYGLLLMAKGFGLDPECLQDAVAGFRDEARFADYARYKLDCKILDSFFRLLRAVYYPTMVTPWDYPSAHALKTADAVRLHLDGDLNPFVAYYQDVLIPRIAETRPGVVGISMAYASQSVQALVLGMLLKERLPQIHITMGGAYLTQWALLMDEPQLPLLFSATDSVICGEGEIPFVQLLDWRSNGTAMADVPNLIFREEDAGEIRQSEALVFTDLTQQPPPDYSDLDLGAYLIPEPVLPYLPTRGCYWQRCGFCQNRIGKYKPRPYQTVPVDKAVAELSELARAHHCRHFHFCGDVIDADYLKAFSRALIDAKTSIFWHTNLRAEEEFSPELCSQLARAGLTSVVTGMESGCQRTLEMADKGLDIGSMGQVLMHFYDAGVATQVTGILGFPDESEAEAQLTIDFLKEHIHSISGFDVGLLLVLPGSAMHNDPASFGVGRISYAQTSLMTPEPLWKAARRIPLVAVERLFEQLGRLEAATCLSNDHPYVGALCANHSFLYFRQGPHILKRLRALENWEHQEVHRVFGMDHRHRPVAGIKPRIPRLRFPYLIYRSPYLHERAHFGTEIRHRRPLAAGQGWDYLLDPINIPQSITPEAQRMLAAIDGQRDLAAVLGPEPLKEGAEEVFSLVRLVLSGLVSLTETAESASEK
jgi:anaerobic magnesium-protoporphyrin IX monomethyl ester cyclase